jgi:23S rRNA (uracil1939-C5)-methyltransferase
MPSHQDKNAATCTVKAEQPVYGGLCLGRHKGKVVMIQGALPGEQVQVSITGEKKDYYTASVINILNPSPDRITPECSYFGACGGCHLQYISYQRQVHIKEDILRDCLRRLAKTDINLSESIIANKPWRYRLRGQFKVANNKIGFYRAKSRELIEIDSCPLMSDGIDEDLQKTKPLIKGLNAGEIHLARADRSIALLRAPAIEPDTAAAQFLKSGFSGVCIQTKDKQPLNYGKPFISLELDDLIYTVSALSFFQSNWEVNRAVVRLIRESLSPHDGLKILDLYAGAGNFSLGLSLHAEVVGVEENPYAIEDGRRNIETNNIKGFRFAHSSAEHFQIQEMFDMVILDPPRPGLTNRVINKLLTALPGKIFYISCNPATFARDLRKLGRKYEVDSIRLIDLFPQTFHIESIACLNRS